MSKWLMGVNELRTMYDLAQGYIRNAKVPLVFHPIFNIANNSCERVLLLFRFHYLEGSMYGK